MIRSAGIFPAIARNFQFCAFSKNETLIVSTVPEIERERIELG